MKSKNGILILALAAFAFSLLSFGFASAVIIGVSPSSINFPGVLRDGYAQSNIVITTDSQSPIEVLAQAQGNISSWLNFTSNFTVSESNPYALTVSVTPPNNIPNGNYSGFVILQTLASGSGSPRQAVGIVESTLDVYVTVEVTDVQVMQCSAASYGVQSVEQGNNAVFVLNVTNSGNVLLRPEIKIDIWNEAQTQIVKTIDVFGNQILPTTQKQEIVDVPTGSLPYAQYWAQVYAPDCLSSDLLTFDVLQPGTLTANGILLNLVAPGIAKVKETIPIQANFQNTGEADVSAQFVGQVTKAGKIVQLLNSPASDVAVGKTGTFNFYFTPESPGNYIVAGRVYYSGKVSYELSTPINVSSPPALSYILPGVYAMLILAIAFLFIKILRERKNYKKILRRLKK